VHIEKQTVEQVNINTSYEEKAEQVRRLHWDQGRHTSKPRGDVETPWCGVFSSVKV
jgi:hypothetical protein